MSDQTVVGVIGGTGLYDIAGLESIKEHALDTPFGAPSDIVVEGVLDGVRVLFLPRHGKGHGLLPSQINYRANICALKMLGAQWCISISAVGSLVEEYAPGDFVVPDQILDRTRGRKSTFFGDGVVAHVSFADPYCPVLRRLLLESAQDLSSKQAFSAHDGGTFICMEGPAFSTRAESHLYRSWGARLIGMTSLPEAKLAREAELAYATLALVTDYDCWREDTDAVEVSHVIEVMQQNTNNARALLKDLIPKMAEQSPSAMAANALETAIFTDLAQAPVVACERLRPIIGRYLEK